MSFSPGCHKAYKDFPRKFSFLGGHLTEDLQGKELKRQQKIWLIIQKNLPALKDHLPAQQYLNIRVILKDNKEYIANRFLLATESPVLRTRLVGDQWKKEEPLNLNDISELQFEIIHGFLTHREKLVELLKSCHLTRILEVYTLAEKYDISSLREECAHILILSLKSENVLEILCTAYIHKNIALRNECTKKLNEFVSQTFSLEWKDVEHCKIIIKKLPQSNKLPALISILPWASQLIIHDKEVFSFPNLVAPNVTEIYLSRTRSSGEEILALLSSLPKIKKLSLTAKSLLALSAKTPCLPSIEILVIHGAFNEKKLKPLFPALKLCVLPDTYVKGYSFERYNNTSVKDNTVFFKYTNSYKYTESSHLTNLDRISEYLDDSILMTIVDSNLTKQWLGISSMDLSYCNKITDKGILHLVQVCKNLKVLSLHTPITDHTLEIISKGLPALECLNLRFCQGVTDQGIISFVQTCKHLEKLDLSNTSISDEALCKILEQAPNLKLSNTPIPDKALCKVPEHAPNVEYKALPSQTTFISSIQTSTTPCKLELSNQPITDEKLVTMVKKFPALEFINLNFCAQLTAGMSVIFNFCTNIKEVQVSGTSINDIGLLAISKLEKLEHINLQGCQAITNNGISLLCRCKNLKFLILADTCVNDETLKKIAENLKDLTSIHLENCSNITEEGVLAFQKIRNQMIRPIQLEFISHKRSNEDSDPNAQLAKKRKSEP